MEPQERISVNRVISMSGPFNCPACGRFLKWDKEKLKFSCKCGRVRTRVGNGSILIDAIETPIKYTGERTP